MVIGAKYSKLHIANLSFISLYIFCTINIRQVDPNQNFTQHEFVEKVYHLVYRGLCIDTRQRLKYRYVLIYRYIGTALVMKGYDINASIKKLSTNFNEHGQKQH